MATLLKSVTGNMSAQGYSNSAYSIKLDTYLNKQEENSSKINYQVFLRTNVSDWGWYSYPSPKTYLQRDKIDINTSKSITNLPTKNQGNWVKVQDYTETINHNSDGTLTINVSAKFSANYSKSYLPKDITIETGNLTIPKINRASTLQSINDFSIDDTITIKYDKYVSTYTNNLIVSLLGHEILRVNGIANNYQLSFNTSQKNAILSYMQTPQEEMEFNLVTMDDTNQVGESKQNAIISSLNVNSAFSVVKKSNGKYVWGINGIADIDGKPLQIFDDNGNLVNDEVVLYNNTEGTLNNVALSQSTSNFDKIKIYYVDTNGIYGEIEGNTGQKVIMQTWNVGASSCSLYLATIQINDTEITRTNYSWARISSTPAYSTGNQYNIIKIYKVVGIS